MNKYVKHVYVIPEDDAVRQLANGFLLHPALRQASIQILPAAGGWREVISQFNRNYAPTLDAVPCRHVVLAIDFDSQPDRRDQVLAMLQLPPEHQHRVFIIGIRSEAEGLKRSLPSQGFEDIGKQLAAECYTGTLSLWKSEPLSVNEEELRRLVDVVRPFIFGDD